MFDLLSELILAGDEDVKNVECDYPQPRIHLFHYTSGPAAGPPARARPESIEARLWDLNDCP